MIKKARERETGAREIKREREREKPKNKTKTERGKEKSQRTRQRQREKVPTQAYSVDIDRLENHHLVLHERDEGRDDQSDSLRYEAWDLIAQTLASACDGRDG